MKDKIYYFQEKSNDILDLQDDFTSEEIGIYFILKAAYFKYAGEIKKDNICQRCKFFGDKTLLNKMVEILFEEQEDLLVNKSWLDDIRDIKERSKKRKEAAEQRWKKEKQKPNKNPRKPKETQSVIDNKSIPPSIDSIRDYCNERMNNIDPQRFFDFYQSKGWLVGKSKMKDWKAALRNWENSNRQELKPIKKSVFDIE
jgi:uncharacterized protein YdaU (DUF1376 family)